MDINDVPTLLEKANSLLQKGDMNESLAIYDSALALAPTNKESLVGKAEVLSRLSRSAEAARYLDYATRNYPDDEKIWYFMGTTALAAGQGDLATRAFSNYQRLVGASTDNFLNLAAASYLNMDGDQAKSFVELALLEDPHNQGAKLWQQKLADIKDKQSLLVDVGRAHCRAKRFEQGLELFTQALELKDSFSARLYTGRAFSALKRFEQAIPHLQAALEMELDNQEVMNDLAMAYRFADQKQQAEQVYDRILELNSSNTNALLGKGQLLFQANNMETALENVNQAINTAPIRPDAWLLKAQLLQTQENLCEARLSADRAINMSMSSPVSWAVGANILLSDHKRALSDLYMTMARHLNRSQQETNHQLSGDGLEEVSAEVGDLDAFLLDHTEYMHAYHDRAAIYEALDELDRSLYYLDIITQKWPEEEDERLICRRGVMLLNLGRHREAQDCFQKALEAYPESEAVQQGLTIAKERLSEEVDEKHLRLIEDGLAHCKERRFKEGLELFTQALELKDSFFVRLYMGRALSALNQYEEAISCLQAAQEMEPEDLDVMIDLAVAHVLTDQKQKAEQIYDKVLNMNSENTDALLGKGQLLLVHGKLKDSQEHIEKAIKIAPSRRGAWLLKAQLLRKQGDLNEARLSVDHAIALNPRSLAGWTLGVVILQACGEQALANRYLTIVRQLDPSKPEAGTEVSRGDLKEVSTEMAELDAIISEHPEYVHAYRDRVDIYETLGEFDRSLYYLDAVLQKWPDEGGNEQIICKRGVILLNLGRFHEAQACFQQALDINPQSNMAQQGLTIATERLSQTLAQAIDKHLQLVDVGINHYQEKRFKESLQVLSQALELGDSLPPRLYMGRAFSALNQYEEAIAHFQAAL